jgi:hypothetical protein
MKPSQTDRTIALAKRMLDTPSDIVARMQAHLRAQEFPSRGMAAAMNDFYARLDAAGLPPELVTEEIYDAVATSRSRLRSLIKGLQMFAPNVPLAPAAPVKQRWDAWLNGRYNAKPKKEGFSRRVGLEPQDWPAPWRDALPVLDKTVRPYGQRLPRPKPKTREAILSAMGLLAESRRWAAERDVQVGCDLTEELFDIYQRYLLLERAVSFRTAADYCERIRMFFMRAGLFDAASLQALSDITGALVEEAADQDRGKWHCIRAFRKSFTLADVVHRAVAADRAAEDCPGHTTQALRLRQKAIVYALLVNTGDRQGDLRNLRIGIDIVRDSSGFWRHGLRQGKTDNTKEIGALWPGTCALIDAHLLADRPSWTINERVEALCGANLLTLTQAVLNNGFINTRLEEDFKLHGHLVRTLITDVIRRERPDALWASREMLGHSDRFTQEVYRSDFAESGAIREMDQLYAGLERAGPT